MATAGVVTGATETGMAARTDDGSTMPTAATALAQVPNAVRFIIAPRFHANLMSKAVAAQIR
jgi:hypothetical protein